jgi:hypothetical protein
MSAETRQALDDAVQEQDEAREVEHRAGRELLDEVAAALPARVERLTRQAMSADADTARALGKEGVQKLRAALRATAEAIGEELRTKPGTPWRGDGRGFHATEYGVTRALEEMFGYPTKNRLDSILRDAGFNSRGPFPSERLAETGEHTDKIKAVVHAADAVSAASKTVSEARKANDDDDVMNLWGE